MDRGQIAAGESVTVSVEVSNTGGVAGDEVVELYMSHPGAESAPIRALTGFARVHLAVGERKTVSIPLSAREMSLVDEAGKRSVLVGAIQVCVGSGQPDLAKSSSVDRAAPTNGAMLTIKVNGPAVVLPD
ncbi:MAG: fibronectin type III-like domain-contianing protein [Bryobacteraceae bacterium]